MDVSPIWLPLVLIAIGFFTGLLFYLFDSTL